MTRKISILLFTGLAAVSVLFAEDDKPAEVDLEIPPVVIEVEHSNQQDLYINIPDLNDITLPEFGLDLPSPADISVSELPFETLSLPSADQTFTGKTASFFSEGNLGLGINNQLTGYIRLYKLGKGLKYSVLFSHNSMDGYGSHSAGEGFFNREELFKGSFSTDEEKISYFGSGSLSETENGMQGLSSMYSSVVHRFRDAGFKVSDSNDRWKWSLFSTLEDADRVLSGSDPLVNSTLLVKPGASLTFKTGRFSVSLNGNYNVEYRDSGDDIYQNMSSDLKISYTFPSVDISGGATACYIVDGDTYFPFFISISGTAAGKSVFDSSFGRKVKVYDNYSLWKDFPLSDSISGSSEEWYFSGSLRSSVTDSVSLYSSVDWEYYDDYKGYSDSSVSDSVTGLFPVVDIKDYNSLVITAGMDIDLKGGKSAGIGWKGQLADDASPFYARQSVFGELKVGSPDADLSGSMSINWDLDPFDSLPELGGLVSYRMSRGVSLEVEAGDLLSVFSGEDRTLLGEYIKPAGTVTARVKISL